MVGPLALGQLRLSRSDQGDLQAGRHSHPQACPSVHPEAPQSPPAPGQSASMSGLALPDDGAAALPCPDLIPSPSKPEEKLLGVCETCSVVADFLGNPMDYSPLGSSVHGFSVQNWCAAALLRGNFPTQGRNQVSPLQADPTI